MIRILKGLTVLVMVGVSWTGHAQHTIKGQVINAAGQPVIGNVIVISFSDSSYLQGHPFLEGNFELTGIGREEVLIKLTSLEFSDTLLHVVLSNRQVVDLGMIQVRDRLESLAEVEITATRPMFDTRPDGTLEVNVTNTVLATSSSVTEILSRSPGVLVADDGISVFGKGLAVLYLNGKRIPPERLASISASQVKSVEIISNPSSRYDAEGQAVINIITLADLGDGYRVTVQQQGSWSDMAGVQGNSMVNLNYKKSKFDFAGNYDLKLGNDSELLYTTRVRPDEADYLSSTLRWDQHRNYRNASNYTLGASYDLGGKAYASAEYNGSYQNSEDLTTSSNHIITNNEDGIYTTRMNRDALIRNNAFTFNLNLQLDTTGSVFFVGGQLSNFNSGIDDNIAETNVVNSAVALKSLKSSQLIDVIIANPQIDLIKVLSSDRKISAGVKLSYARTKSSVGFFEAVEGGFDPDTTRSNNFLYTEMIPAAYVQFEGAGKKVSYSIGLRSEWTSYTLQTTARGNYSNTSSYLNLFPSIRITLNVTEQLKLRALYTSRIVRPPYQALSPSLIYQDAFTSTEGNPNLLPEKIHSFELGAAWGVLDIKAGYNYSLDPLDGAALRGEDEKSYVLKRINFEKGHSWFASVTGTFSNYWLTSVNTFSLTYGKLIDNQYNYELVGETPQVYAYSSNKINVNNWFNVHVLAWYLSSRYISTRQVNSTALITLGVDKEFFKKSLRCSFTANDILHSNFPSGSYTVGETYIVYNRWFNTQYFRLAVTYSFGQLKKASYRNRATGEVENSRAR